MSKSKGVTIAVAPVSKSADEGIPSAQPASKEAAPERDAADETANMTKVNAPDVKARGRATSGGSDVAHQQVSRIRDRFKLIAREAIAFRHKTFEMSDDQGKLPLVSKIVYGLPQFSLTSLTMLIGIHGTIFYTKVGADVAFIAFFTALARSFDVVTDPLMGWISDQTRSRWGRRRPFMAFGCWFYAGLFIALMSPPESLQTGQSVALWFGFFYVIFYLGDTMSNVPYGAWGPELSDDSKERDSLFFWAKLFNGIGILCGAVGPVVLTIFFRDSTPECACDTKCPFGADAAAKAGVAWSSADYGSFPGAWYNDTVCDGLKVTVRDTPYETQLHSWCGCRGACEGLCDVAVSRRAFTTTAIIFGVIYVSAMLLLVATLRERKASLDMTTPPIVPSLLATLRNKPFIGLLPAWVCDMTAYTMIGTMLPFYVEYVIIPKSVPECADGKRAALGLDPSDVESPEWCKTETWLGFGLVMLIGAQIASMPVWLWATSKFGKFKTWLAFNCSTAITNGLFVFIGRGDPKACMGLAMLNGLPSGAQFLTDSVVADVIDYDEFLTGQRSEGRFTIFQTFIPKIVSIPAQAIPLALLTVFGFKPPEAGVPVDQDSAVVIFIQVVFFVLPCGLAIASFFIKTRFPIRTPETIAKIQEGAALHMRGHPAKDPLTKRTVKLFDVPKEQAPTIWLFDNFFKHQLEILVGDGRGSRAAASGAENLRKNQLRTLQTCIVWSLVSLVVCVSSVAGGLLLDPRLSWLPAFTVISFGMGTTAVAFNYLRYKAALGFVVNGFDQDLARRWLNHLKGLDDNGDPLPDLESKAVLDVDPAALGIKDGAARQSSASAAQATPAPTLATMKEDGSPGESEDGKAL